MSGDPDGVRRAVFAGIEDLVAFGLDELLLPASAPRASPRSTPPAESGPAAVPAPERRGLPRPPMAEVPAAVEAPTILSRPPAAPEVADSLDRIAAEVAACTRCRLSSTRTRVVPGQGNPRARLFFVGEAPGYDEDRSGLAFVGLAGQLLTRMIEAMGLSRDEVFIANVLKCRPPENREPASDEAAACLPFLRRQVALVRPELIVCLGSHAVRGVLSSEASVGRLRGRPQQYAGIPVVVTYHPSYLLRMPEMKKPAWEDLKLALKLLGLPVPTRGAGA